jgi:glycogen(starch) synthase
VSQLRVLRVASVFPPPPAAAPDTLAAFDPFGGMQSHTGQLSAALDDLGVAQIVLTAWRPGAARRTPLGRHGEVLRLGIPLRRLRQLYGIAAAPRLPALARNRDVVHVHLGEDLAALPLGLAAARLAGAPLVLTVHCSLRHTLAGRGARTAVLRTVGAAQEGVVARRASRVLALTAGTAAALARDGVQAERLAVIPSGVDLRRFADATDDPLPEVPSRRVLYVGRLAAQKGPVTAVRAFARMRIDATLVVVGDGPLRRLVEATARGCGIADRVRMVGFVPHEEVRAYLRHADVLVLPSLYEELGSVLLEAMAAGLPVVASAVGGIPTVVRDGVTGLLVAPRDEAGFAAALDRVLADEALRGGLSQAGRRAARAYDWRRLAGRVLDVYDAALVEGTCRPRRRGEGPLTRAGGGDGP